jgi:hypothetical protein
MYKNPTTPMTTAAIPANIEICLQRSEGRQGRCRVNDHDQASARNLTTINYLS